MIHQESVAFLASSRQGSGDGLELVTHLTDAFNTHQHDQLLTVL